MLHYVFGSFETVQLNFKISRTPENEPCYYHSPSPSKGDLVGWFLLSLINNIDDMAVGEVGACFDVWLYRTLTTKEKTLLKEYEMYLESFKNMDYSFGYEFKVQVFTKFEKKQLLDTIGYVPEEEIYICGLATPLFRSIEAILKHFGGYAKIGLGEIYKEQPAINGRCFEIRKSKSDPYYKYIKRFQLIDWEMLANVYNLNDPPEIKEIYSIQNFINQKLQKYNIFYS
jgi:hypothetical protein